MTHKIMSTSKVIFFDLSLNIFSTLSHLNSNYFKAWNITPELYVFSSISRPHIIFTRNKPCGLLKAWLYSSLAGFYVMVKHNNALTSNQQTCPTVLIQSQNAVVSITAQHHKLPS